VSGAGRRGPGGAAVAGALLAAALLAAGPAGAAEDLADLYRLALGQDQTYLAAVSATAAAREAVPQARAGLLPSLNVSASAFANEVDVRDPSALTGRRGRSDFTTREIGVSVSQPLYRRDRLIQLGQARDQVRRAEVELELAGQDLILRLAERYFALLGALDEVELGQAVVEAFGEQLKQARQRFEVGLIAITDVEEAQAGYDQATAQLISARNQVDTEREALREITGRHLTEVAPLGPGFTLAPPDPDDIEAWTEDALKRNLAVAAARYAVAVARDEIARVEAGHLPTVDLVGSHSRSHSGSSGGSSTWSSALGVQVNLSLYQGGRVVSQTRASRFRYRQSLEELEARRRAVLRETRSAFLNVKSGISQVRAIEQAVRSSESAARAIKAGFEVGTRTSVEVLNAQRDLFRARRDVLAARYRYILNLLRLKRAAGTLGEEDVARISAWLEG